MAAEAVDLAVGGKVRKCPICGHGKFVTRTTMLNTRGFTFMGIDWANRDAVNYICTGCGHILWFVPGVDPGTSSPRDDII